MGRRLKSKHEVDTGKHIRCISCQRPINANITTSDKLKGECNRCYRENTNKGEQRKNNKRKTLMMKANRLNKIH